MAHLLPGAGVHRQWRPSLRPLSLVIAINSALLCMAATDVRAQQNDTSSTPAEVSTERVDSRKLPEIEVKDTAEDQHKPGSSVKVTKDDLDKQGAGGFADVLKYQPLVSVPGVSSGVDGTSTYDHPGSTNYNIRGVEGNRIGIDVDDVEMPDAVGRQATSSEGRTAGTSTFSQGRAYIDPEIYSEVQVDSGTTTAARPAGGIGGSVSFRTKSAEDYVSDAKSTYAGVKVGYNSANRSWNEAVTGAGKAGDLEGLIVYSHRDGHETENNSSVVNSYPSSWSSDAVLLKGSMRLNAENKLTVTADIYRRNDDNAYPYWNTAGTAVAGNAVQHSTTARDTLQLGHLWTPANALLDKLETKLSYQGTNLTDSTVQTTTAGVVTHPYSVKNTKQFLLSSTATKQLDNNRIRFGVNASDTTSEQNITGVSTVGQPAPNSQTFKYGAFVDDEIVFNPGGHRLAVLPGLRVDYTRSGVYDMASYANSTVSVSQLQTSYGNGLSTTIVSPSLSVVYDIVPTVSAYAQWKHGGRAPSSAETYGAWSTGYSYILIGNTNLKPETSDAFDFGLKGEPVDGLTFKSSVFYTRYKNFIDYQRYDSTANPELFTNITSYSVIYQAVNRDKAFIYGWEMSANIDHGKFIPALEGTYSTIGLGISQGKSKSDYPGDSYTDLATVPPAKLVVSLGYDAPNKTWGTKLTGTAVRSKQAYYTNRNLASTSTTSPVAVTGSSSYYYRIPGYASYDLTGYWHVAKNVTLHAGINNLFNKTYWNYADVYSLTPTLAQDVLDMQLKTSTGRSVFVSASMDF